LLLLIPRFILTLHKFAYEIYGHDIILVRIIIVIGKCSLCDTEAELKKSHIIPKFVFNWFKETGGAMRSKSQPNLRIQDGEKEYLLCSDCEELFSGWEKLFSEKFFLPLHGNPSITTPFKYGSWALKFAVSVSWRVLLYYYQLHDLSHFSRKQKKSALEALGVWRGFMLGKLPHAGQFEQHLVTVDVIESYSGPKISPFLNRYLSRSIHMDVICSDKTAMVYTKMGRLIIFGFIQGNSKRWKGTKLHVNKGLIMQKDCRLPQSIANYWNYKANEVAESFAMISPKQKQKIHESILDNADALATADFFRGMQYDLYHSGKNSFTITESTKNDTQ